MDQISTNKELALLNSLTQDERAVLMKSDNTPKGDDPSTTNLPSGKDCSKKTPTSNKSFQNTANTGNLSTVPGGDKARKAAEKAAEKAKKAEEKALAAANDPLQLSDVQVVAALTSVLQHKQRDSHLRFAHSLPKIPHTFKSFADDGAATPIVASIVDNTAKIIQLGRLRAELHDYCSRIKGKASSLGNKSSLLNATAAIWSQSGDVIEPMPNNWAFQNDPELCFNRIPYIPQSCTWAEVEEAAPIFAELISRLEGDDTQLLLQWIGSLLTKGSCRRQVVWLEGEQLIGKGLLTGIIQSLLPNEVVSNLDSEFMESNHMMTMLENRRLVVVDEANSSFVNSTAFKRITGGSKQVINPKGKDAYIAVLDTKFIFVANPKSLTLRRDPAAMGRILLFKMREREAGAEDIQPEVIIPAMAPARAKIAGYCIDLYKRHTKNNGLIEKTASSVEAAVEDGEFDFDNFLDETFEVGEGLAIPSAFFTEALSKVSWDSSKKKAFRNYLTTKYPYTNLSRAQKQHRFEWWDNNKKVRSFAGLGRIDY